MAFPNSFIFSEQFMIAVLFLKRLILPQLFNNVFQELYIKVSLFV